MLIPLYKSDERSLDDVHGDPGNKTLVVDGEKTNHIHFHSILLAGVNVMKSIQTIAYEDFR